MNDLESACGTYPAGCREAGDPPPPGPSRPRRFAVALGLSVALAGASVQPLAGEIPPVDQVETFVKIFAFDRALAGESPTVLLVAPDEEPASLDEVRVAFAGAGMQVRTATASRAGDEMGDASVVYFEPRSVTAAAQEAAVRAGALSIAAEPHLAASGQVSVALDERADRIGIVVSVPRLSLEKHSLSPQLLRQPWVSLSREIGPPASDESTPDCQVADFAAPDYPVAARRMGAEGTVRLRVRVGSDLQGAEVEVVESVHLLDEVATRAAMRSRYASPGWCSLSIPFRLE